MDRSCLLGWAGLPVDLNLLQRVYLTSSLGQGLPPLPRAREQRHALVAAVTCGAVAGGGRSVTGLSRCCGVSASPRGRRWQRSSHCDIGLAVECIIKGKYLRLRDVCLLEPTHTRQDSLFSANSNPSCC